MAVRQGFFQMLAPCPRCEGRGRIIPKPCRTCHGEGRIHRKSKVSFKVPADAATDLVEWASPSRESDPVLSAFQSLLQNEVPIEAMINESPTTPALSDDWPINEYYALRRWAVAAPTSIHPSIAPPSAR